MTTPIDMALAAEIVAAGTASGKMVVTAESCTGGMVAAALTDISGASAVLDRGLVTYSNDAKSGLLGVAGATLASHGARRCLTRNRRRDGSRRPCRRAAKPCGGGHHRYCRTWRRQRGKTCGTCLVRAGGARRSG